MIESYRITLLFEGKFHIKVKYIIVIDRISFKLQRNESNYLSLLETLIIFSID